MKFFFSEILAPEREQTARRGRGANSTNVSGRTSAYIWYLAVGRGGLTWSMSVGRESGRFGYPDSLCLGLGLINYLVMLYRRLNIISHVSLEDA